MNVYRYLIRKGLYLYFAIADEDAMGIARSSIFIGAAMAIAVCTQAAAGSKLTIKSTVRLKGFTDGRIQTGFKSTDIESWHVCTTGFDASCTASNGYSSTPKNINEYLCFPSELRYVVDDECQRQLSSAVRKCHAPSLPGSCKGHTSIKPVCQWETVEVGTTEWEWTMSAPARPGDPYAVSCRKTGFAQPH